MFAPASITRHAPLSRKGRSELGTRTSSICWAVANRRHKNMQLVGSLQRARVEWWGTGSRRARLLERSAPGRAHGATDLDELTTGHKPCRGCWIEEVGSDLQDFAAVVMPRTA